MGSSGKDRGEWGGQMKSGRNGRKWGWGAEGARSWFSFSSSSEEQWEISEGLKKRWSHLPPAKFPGGGKSGCQGWAVFYMSGDTIVTSRDKLWAAFMIGWWSCYPHSSQTSLWPKAWLYRMAMVYGKDRARLNGLRKVDGTTWLFVAGYSIQLRQHYRWVPIVSANRCASFNFEDEVQSRFYNQTWLWSLSFAWVPSTRWCQHF